MKNITVIKDKIYPIIAKAIEKNRLKYVRYMGKFISARYDDLYDIAPCRRIPFLDKERDEFFSSINVNKNDVKEALKYTYYANKPSFNPSYAKDETTIALLCLIRYFLLNKKKYSKELHLSLVNFSFSGKMYPSIHYAFFKVVQPIEYRYIMDFVVNNVLSNKFILKQTGNVVDSICSLCDTWCSAYDDRFKDFDDEDVVYLVQQIHDRIKSFMKNIASAYYEAYENRDQYINFSSDNYSEDNFRIADNDQTKLVRVADNAINKVIRSGVDYKLCQMSSNNTVHTDELKSIITEIIHNDTKGLVVVKDFINSLVSLYFSESKDKDVRNLSFITFCVTPKPNSKNKLYIHIMETVDKWLTMSTSKYNRRKSSINAKKLYEKAVLLYFALTIHQANLK